MYRVCRKCERSLLLAESFHNSKRCPLGKVYTCKQCVGKAVAKWSQTPHGRERARAAKRKYNATPVGKARRLAYQQLPEQRAAHAARSTARRKTQAGKAKVFEAELRRYNISVEDWARLFNFQNGRCQGCTRPLLFDSSTHLDHCHKSGRVRGLLCRGCNIALGAANDNVETLRTLIEYLEKHREN